jgi:phosphatidylethanolamine-binding protein (PEBP) family uncharacterized protein
MAPMTLQSSPIVTVFFLPSLSPAVNATKAPKKAPSYALVSHDRMCGFAEIFV